MSPRAKFGFIAFGIIWLIVVIKGNFIHDKPHANDMDLITDAGVYRNIRLNIDRVEKQTDGSMLISASIPYRGKPAAVEVLIGPDWKLQNGMEKPTYKGKVTLKSLGAESDHFLAMMDEYYVTQMPPKAMVDGKIFNALLVEGDPKVFDSGQLRIDVFHSGKDEDHYAEFNLDLDYKQKEIVFEEKDTQYRKPILWALRGE
jgi:hypothetical protein